MQHDFGQCGHLCNRCTGGYEHQHRLEKYNVTLLSKPFPGNGQSDLSHARAAVSQMHRALFASMHVFSCIARCHTKYVDAGQVGNTDVQGAPNHLMFAHYKTTFLLLFSMSSLENGSVTLVMHGHLPHRCCGCHEHQCMLAHCKKL